MTPIPITLNQFLSNENLTRREAHNFRCYAAKKLTAVGKYGRSNQYNLEDLHATYLNWQAKRVNAVYATPYHGADIIGIGACLLALAALCLITIYILTH